MLRHFLAECPKRTSGLERGVFMINQNCEARVPKKPELTEADKALLEAEPDWERMGEAAKRLLTEMPTRHLTTKVAPLKTQEPATDEVANLQAYECRTQLQPSPK